MDLFDIFFILVFIFVAVAYVWSIVLFFKIIIRRNMNTED